MFEICSQRFGLKFKPPLVWRSRLPKCASIHLDSRVSCFMGDAGIFVKARLFIMRPLPDAHAGPPRREAAGRRPPPLSGGRRGHRRRRRRRRRADRGRKRSGRAPRKARRGRRRSSVWRRYSTGRRRRRRGPQSEGRGVRCGARDSFLLLS